MGRMNRRSLIAKIKIGQKQLGLENWEYRQFLIWATGKSSCTELEDFQLIKVLEEMKRMGFQPSAPKKHTPPKHCESKDAMISKVGALLADNKLPWAYAHAMAKRMFKVDRVEWLTNDHLHKLIAALQLYADRR